MPPGIEIINMLSTANANSSWLPSETGSLVVQPVTTQSVAITALGTGGTTTATDRVHDFRVPIWKSDPTAAWVGEGEEITSSEGQLAEEADDFHKLAGLVAVSKELAADTNPDAAEQVGLGLARDIARKLDAAFFGAREADDNLAPRGLGNIEGVGTISAGSAWKDSDPFVTAIYAAEGVGATLAAFVANPVDAQALAKLKAASGSNLPLLGADPTQPSRRVISGVPVYASSAVTQGTIWGLPGAGLVLIAIREDVELTRDESVYFTSDRVAIKATMRVTTLFPHPAAIQKITIGA